MKDFIVVVGSSKYKHESLIGSCYLIQKAEIIDDKPMVKNILVKPFVKDSNYSLPKLELLALVDAVRNLPVGCSANVFSANQNLLNTLSGKFKHNLYEELYAEFEEVRAGKDLYFKNTHEFENVSNEIVPELKRRARKEVDSYRENEVLESCDYHVYGDGSCNNFSVYGEGGAAYVIVQNGEVIKKNSKGFLNTTNNRMEMLAIISGVLSTPDRCKICIFTDSQIAIKAFSDLAKWRDNQDLIQLYARSVGHRKIIFRWVKGHSGNEFNELCDALSNDARENIRIENNIPIYTWRNSPKVQRKS